MTIFQPIVDPHNYSDFNCHCDCYSWPEDYSINNFTRGLQNPFFVVIWTTYLRNDTSIKYLTDGEWIFDITNFRTWSVYYEWSMSNQHVLFAQKVSIIYKKMSKRCLILNPGASTKPSKDNWQEKSIAWPTSGVNSITWGMSATTTGPCLH